MARPSPVSYVTTLAVHLDNVTSTRSCTEDTFGPASCRGDFDFTLAFEQSILSCLPSVIFILASSWRIWQLRRASSKVEPDLMKTIKVTTALAYAAIELAVLIFWRTRIDLTTHFTMAAASLSFVTAVYVVGLSVLEHDRSVRPSALLTVYLLLSILFSAAQTRTLFLMKVFSDIPAVVTASLGIKIVLLMLELQTKRRYLKAPFKHYSDETTSGLLDWSFLTWLNGLFRLGFRKLLTFDDLSRIDEKFRSGPMRERILFHWNARKGPEGKYTLVFALVQCLKWELLAACVPRFLLIPITFSQPFLIQRAVNYFAEPEDAQSRNIGYGLIGATFLIYLSRTLLNVQYRQRFAQVLTLFRGCCISLIYDSTLTMIDSSKGSEAVTLMSADIQSCLGVLPSLNDLWASLIEIVVAIYLLARQMGAFCIVPIVCWSIFTFTQKQLAKQFGERVKNWNGKTQLRISTTATALSAMRSLRMTGLADSVQELIAEQRATEIQASMGFRSLIVILNLLVNGAELITPVVLFVAYEIRARMSGSASLNTAQAFTALSILTLLSEPAAQILIGFPLTASCLGALGRIQAFLLRPVVVPRGVTSTISKVETSAVVEDGLELQSMAPRSAILRLDNVSVGFGENDTTLVLQNISCKFYRGTLSMILGPVGCGKSTLLKAILGEVPLKAGNIINNMSSFSFASQAAWLTNNTIQASICGPRINTAIDEVFYAQVIHACALTEDLNQLADGDRTLIGSRGVTLSGGQRQRIALARALYARQDILLLDDILSALDTKTENLVVNRLFGKEGLLRRLGTTTILVTHQVRHLALADEVVILGRGGSLLANGDYQSLLSGGFLSEEILQQMRAKPDYQEKNDEVLKTIPGAAGPTDEQKLDLTRQVGDLTVYRYYARSVGFGYLFLFLGFCALYAFFSSFSQVWLKWWTNDNGARVAFWLTGFAIIAILSFFGNYGYLYVCLVKMFVKSSTSLHSVLLETVFNAPQAFFSTTDTGITLNRFSQDIIVVDRDLLGGVIAAGGALFRILASTGLVLSSSTYMATLLPFLVITLYAIQDVYLKTSRQLRYHELESKSPLYTHFLETLEGLSVIRAFGWQHEATETSLTNLDHSQTPYYLLESVQTWLLMALDLMTTCLAIVVMTLAIELRSSTSGALLAIALINLMTFTSNLGQGVQAFTQLEISLGAIARIRSFAATTVPEHQPNEVYAPGPTWPSEGTIKFSKLSAAYNNTTTPALSSIDLDILPGQKIGICGRTGSGKSTILATLLRLVEISSGTITIDGVDIATIPRSLLRSSFAAIPQESFILAGSVRINADPTNESTDTAIIAALEKVGLWDVINTRGGLDATLVDHPLSQGQQQLFGLARAMLRGTRSKILILDEATSNVDRDTDKVMQRIIRNEFKEHTILTVAHRLETIMDSDRILVLERGQVLEFGSPEELLKREGGTFREMYGK